MQLQQVETGQGTNNTTVERITIDPALRLALPHLARSLAAVGGSMLEQDVQHRLDEVARRFSEWRAFIAGARRPLSLRPLCVGPLLPMTPTLLVALSRALFPGYALSPYDIGPCAVTTVRAQGGASQQSHSLNDLPAPPHTAAFFGPELPRIAVFGGVRPHPGGGGETTVVDVARVLDRLPANHVRELRQRDFHFRTPKRLGATLHPFRPITVVDGLPFIRHRLDYTLERGAALRALDALICDPAMQYATTLHAGDVLLLWNGAPHGRRPQLGPTPRDPGQRRTLLRCRLTPARR